MARGRTLIATVSLVVLLVTGPPATAQFRGTNGLVAFRDGNGQIAVMERNGSHRKVLTDYAGYATDPAFSPDGKWIVFAASPSGGFADIYKMHPDGSKVRQLTDTVESDANPSWSPNGKWIIWSKAGDISRMAANGTDVRSLGSSVPGFWPRYSPDGHTIIFTSSALPYELYAMTARGGDVHPIASSTADDCCAEFSPDGKRIVFVSGRSGSQQVWTARADGSAPHQMSTELAGVGFANYSPDGKMLVYDLPTAGKIVFRTVKGWVLAGTQDGSGPFGWQPT